MPGLIVPQWRQTWSARVIKNELFLYAIHTIDNSGMSDRALRSIIHRGYTYFIPRHVDPSQQVAALKRTIASLGETEELFSECRKILGSCKICLTDHCTTRAAEASKESVAGHMDPASVYKLGLDHHDRRLPSAWTLSFSI